MSNGMEPMLEMYIYESNQLIDRLEQVLMTSENTQEMDEAIDEIFRIMHTLKGNSMMMMFEDIAEIAHAVEDLFDYVRQVKDSINDFTSMIDLVLESLDFIKIEIGKVEAGEIPDGKSKDRVLVIKEYLESLKFMNPNVEKETTSKTVKNQKFYIGPVKSEAAGNEQGSESEFRYFEAVIFFEDGCEMENVRAFTIAHNIKEMSEDTVYYPEDIVENDGTIQIIREEGFHILFRTKKSKEDVDVYFESVAFMKSVDLNEIDSEQYNTLLSNPSDQPTEPKVAKKPALKEAKDSPPVSFKKGLGKFISVGVNKVDVLMDLVGELVVSESMVTNHPEVMKMQHEGFDKAKRQHRLIIKELQDVVMSIRMVPLELTFQKMNRIVRDISKKVEKDVKLEIVGAETEVDKSIIEHIGDPLMHVIRNSMDHGIESPSEREASGKDPTGSIRLEANQSGGYVYIRVRDDGRGIDCGRVLNKAQRLGLLTKDPEEYLEKEVYSFMFNPGFSTNDEVTEYSGRGVGLDVVVSNIETIGGNIAVESDIGEGTEFTFKIPLTLAIIEGMLMQVGESKFSVPITSIKESMSVQEKEVIKDPDGREMIMIRGVAYPITRLHKKFGIETRIKDISKGILIMIENEGNTAVLLADSILGEQQLVVKGMSKLLNKVQGVSGCALLGDGSITMILDPAGLVSSERG